MSLAPSSLWSRRHLLRWTAATALAGLWPTRARAHEAAGPLPRPAPAPSLWLAGEDGDTFELRQALRGHVTAVQLVFTRCTATCPLQGALFGSVSKRLPVAEAQLLSLSIDPEDDTPADLRAWRNRYAPATRAWRAAAPAPHDLDRLLSFLRGRAPGADRHTAQVHIFDRAARLVYRTADLPTGQAVVDALAAVAARSG